MKMAMRSFLALSAFAIGLGTLYWFLTYEWTGSILLWALGLMPLIVAVWAHRRGLIRHPGPDDDPDAEPGDAAGTSIGSFPLSTAWPVFVVMGVILAGASLIYGLILLPVGSALLGWAVFGLMRESRG